MQNLGFCRITLLSGTYQAAGWGGLALYSAHIGSDCLSHLTYFPGLKGKETEVQEQQVFPGDLHKTVSRSGLPLLSGKSDC